MAAASDNRKFEVRGRQSREQSPALEPVEVMALLTKPAAPSAVRVTDDELQAVEDREEEPLAFEEALKQVEKHVRLAAAAHRRELHKLRTKAVHLANRLRTATGSRSRHSLEEVVCEEEDEWEAVSPERNKLDAEGLALTNILAPISETVEAAEAAEVPPEAKNSRSRAGSGGSMSGAQARKNSRNSRSSSSASMSSPVQGVPAELRTEVDEIERLIKETESQTAPPKEAWNRAEDLLARRDSQDEEKSSEDKEPQEEGEQRAKAPEEPRAEEEQQQQQPQQQQQQQRAKTPEDEEHETKTSSNNEEDSDKSSSSSGDEAEHGSLKHSPPPILKDPHNILARSPEASEDCDKSKCRHIGWDTARNSVCSRNSTESVVFRRQSIGQRRASAADFRRGRRASTEEFSRCGESIRQAKRNTVTGVEITARYASEGDDNQAAEAAEATEEVTYESARSSRRDSHRRSSLLCVPQNPRGPCRRSQTAHSILIGRSNVDDSDTPRSHGTYPGNVVAHSEEQQMPHPLGIVPSFSGDDLAPLQGRRQSSVPRMPVGTAEDRDMRRRPSLPRLNRLHSYDQTMRRRGSLPRLPAHHAGTEAHVVHAPRRGQTLPRLTFPATNGDEHVAPEALGPSPRMSICVSQASEGDGEKTVDDEEIDRQNSLLSEVVSVHSGMNPNLARRASNVKEFWPLPGWEVDDECLNVERAPFFWVEADIMARTRSGSEIHSMVSVNRFRFRNFFKCSMIHPQSKYRLAFDILALFVMIYDIVMIPVVISFDLQEGPVTTFMDWFTVLFWTLDVSLSMNTGFYNSDGSLILKRQKVIWNYVRTWLTLDICILVPEWFLLANRGRGSIAESVGALKTVRFIRILRLLRLVKVDKIIRDLQARINSNFFLLGLGILRLISCLSIIIHFVACMWYGLGASADGWVGAMSLMDASVWHKYLTSVHWSLCQFHGSTDVNPTNELERFVSVVVLLVALILFSSFLSSITHMMMQLSSLRQKRTEHLRALWCFLDDHNISPELSVRVKKYVEGKAPMHQKERDVEFLRVLPKQLMMDLHEEARIPTITDNPFLIQLRDKHPRVVRQLCHESVFQGCFMREDVIFAKGDSSQRMFFVEWGTARYHDGGRQRDMKIRSRMVTKKSLGSGIGTTEKAPAPTPDGWSLRDRFLNRAGKRSFTSFRLGTSTYSDLDALPPGAKDLRRGRWLAEASLWTKWEHRGDFEATSNCSVLMLDAKEFQRVVENYEEAFAECVLYARAFVEALNAIMNVSDLMDFTVTRRSTSHPW